jgi:hypothetical protein
MKPRLIIAWSLVTSALALGAKAQERIPGDAGYEVFADLKSYQECDLSRYEKNFLSALDYRECNEIVECGLAQVAMVKLAQPDAKCKLLQKKVDELTIHGETPSIRYRAYLTGMVFEHPELFIYEKYGNYQNGDELFNALAERLQIESLTTQHF